MPIKYDKNTDYQALINQAVAAGDYKAAGQYEQQRNAKIAGEGLKQYQKTQNFGSVYDQAHFTNDQLGAAYQMRQAAQSGTTGIDSAHSFTEKTRAGYGYSGGADGSEYIPLSKGASGTFRYQSAPAYQDKYESQIEDLLGQILDRDEFSYNALEDPLYQQYRDQYRREGERAMQDTLGQLSARTGGLASSWAGSAAQQQNDYYASMAADRIPELYQLAYSMYMDGIEGKVRDLGLLEQMSDSQYGRYRDTVDDWRNDRSFAYQKYRDDVADQRYSDETDYSRDLYQSETDYARALEKAKTLAAMGDFSGYKALGYSDGEIARMQAALTPAAPAAGPYTDGSTAAGGEDMDLYGLFQAAKESGEDPREYIKQRSNYRAHGLDSAPSYDSYEAWLGRQRTMDTIHQAGIESGYTQGGSWKLELIRKIRDWMARGEMSQKEAERAFRQYGIEPVME